MLSIQPFLNNYFYLALAKWANQFSNKPSHVSVVQLVLGAVVVEHRCRPPGRCAFWRCLVSYRTTHALLPHELSECLGRQQTLQCFPTTTRGPSTHTNTYHQQFSDSRHCPI